MIDIQRHIDIESISSFSCFTCGGIKVSLIMSMHAEVQHLVIFVKHVLCSIAMMNVPIHDEHFLAETLFTNTIHRNHCVVKQAETHCFMMFTVMSRRPHQRKSIIVLVLQYSRHQINGGSSCQLGRSRRVLVIKRVAVIPAIAGLIPHTLHMLLCVRSLQLILASFSRLDLYQTRQNPEMLQHSIRHRTPFRTLDMRSMPWFVFQAICVIK
mmetsp:Transcript_33456/g.53584  ORF Transcript_33456/g.53584 Transcript_33456/m.53584 type:complete len:211 (-) Transcript_33456:683-1315(-)